MVVTIKAACVTSVKVSHVTTQQIEEDEDERREEDLCIATLESFSVIMISEFMHKVHRTTFVCFSINTRELKK